MAARDTLATIHDRCRDAFAAPDGPPPGLPKEWLHVLPARLAHAATRGAGEHDVLCSNIGTLPESLAILGPHRATGVATRALHPGLNSSHLADLRTRLAGYLCRTRKTYTLALVGLDAVITSDTHLRDLAAAELARWGLVDHPLVTRHPSAHMPHRAMSRRPRGPACHRRSPRLPALGRRP